MLRQLSIAGCFILFLLPIQASTQEVLLEERVPNDSTADKFGPGRRHYLHPLVTLGLGFGPPEASGSAIEFWGSGSFGFGLRYKLKILKRWELGIGIRYERESFRIEQDSGKKVFGPVQHKREKLILNDLSGTFYNRFVFGKRGDFVGTFLDLGGYADLSLGKKHLTVDKVKEPSKAGYKKVKSKRKGLNYVERMHYGVLARIGYNRWTLFARYRLSDLFLEGGIADGYPELPRFRVGIQIGLHR